ncbi:MAG: hypothetical protein JW751_08640 [Polyangiaceae bacterium]|nr:hypothetical protein [Polyangiaceae bacterium]
MIKLTAAQKQIVEALTADVATIKATHGELPSRDSFERYALRLGVPTDELMAWVGAW